jgi:hypothetical protein
VADATLAATGGRDPFRLFRVSHTGGHRFAPTGMTLPDGRMWARLSVATIEQVLTRTGDPAQLASRCRGWWGADEGPAQVAERAVLAAEGWTLNDGDREVEIDRADDGRLRCTVRTENRVWEVVLSPGRLVPTIACRQPGGLPVKRAQEYDVLAVSRTG